jgi:uncharacterized membrane protein YbhN (UPF0104 family)
MTRASWRPIATVSILVVTVATFIYYFAGHPAVRHQLGRTSPAVLAIILGLYVLSMAVLAAITLATLRLCNTRLKVSESLLLTAYTAVINFFGPLQSGPAFRAVYLKKKHGLKLKDYTLATLVYYFFFGAFSCLWLVSGLLKWWLLPIAIAGGLLALSAVRHRRLADRLRHLNLPNVYYLALATLAQVVVITLIYYTELASVAPGTRFSQAVIYTGAANLALFVSLTPGAIGFRESFLVFSQRLHHISGGTIVAANILDRAMYIVLLVILALFIFGTHAQNYLKRGGIDAD